MAFFLGPPDRSSPGHDELAQHIAENAVEFVKTAWRWEDLQAYVSPNAPFTHLKVLICFRLQMYRLLLEYARACSHDREAMSYSPV